MDSKFQEYNKNLDSERIQSSLEGIVQILQSLETLKQQVTNIDNRVSVLERQQQTSNKVVTDTLLISNNVLNEIEDIHSEIDTLSNQIDTLDYDVKNIKLFKYVSET
jgi:predicted  nucleic acid-binding Zn-ribbon protein